MDQKNSSNYILPHGHKYAQKKQKPCRIVMKMCVYIYIDILKLSFQIVLNDNMKIEEFNLTIH
jgi:hypothetical protein